jgi:ankyrin repeat protein
MKLAVELELAGEAKRIAQTVGAAIAGDSDRVATLLERDPDLPRRSLAVACVVGDHAAVEARLERTPDVCERAHEPLEWTPLLYACSSRLHRSDEVHRAMRIQLARRLLVCGADPNASCAATDTADGRRSCLAAAVRFVRSPDLARLLLDAGAEPHDLNASTAAALFPAEAREESHALLRLLLGQHPPAWHLPALLAARVERDDAAGVHLLLDHGASPSNGGGWGRGGTMLHFALLRGAGEEVVRLLLERGVRTDARDRDGRTAYAVAVRCGRDDAVALLKQHGAPDDDLGIADRIIAACLRGDVDAVRRETTAHRDLAATFLRTDHQMLSWVIRSGQREAVPLLLQAGLDPDIPDDDGRSPLHLAAAAADAAVVDQLLRAGASVNAFDQDARTPLDYALRLSDPRLRRDIAARLLRGGADASMLTSFPTGDDKLDDDLRARGAVEQADLEEAFERAADAICNGHAETLRELLRDEPGLVHARSRRPHRSTLLHYIASNGIEHERQRTPANAAVIAEILLAAGAEPDALCATYGGGPAQTTMNLLVSSGFPAEAGVQGDLVRVLYRAGAKPDGVDGEGDPMATAIAFRSVQAAAALAEVARLDNALFAAAAGRLDLVEKEMGDGARLRPGSGYCRVPWLHMSHDTGVAAQQALVAAAMFGHLDIVQRLVERGVDPSATPPPGSGPLHEAAFAGHLEVVAWLLDRGADAGRRDTQWEATPLGWADQNGQTEVMSLLIERHQPDVLDAARLGLLERTRELLDADPQLANAPDGRGGILRIAAYHGQSEIVQLLLDCGADPSLKNAEGQTAVGYARQQGHTEVVRLLEKTI